MRKKLFTAACIILLAGCARQTSFAQDYEFVRENQLAVSAGIEYLNYQESDPDIPLNSESKPSNTVLRLKYKASISDALQFVGKLTFPIALQPRIEEWKSRGAVFQTNGLEYRWTRLDAYVLSEYRNDYAAFFGMRIGQANQTRKNFVTSPPSSIGEVVETINSAGLLAGLQSKAQLKKLGLKFHALYVFPVSVRVTNTAVPGSFNNRSGYTLEGGVEIFAGNKVSLEVTGGKMHWNGSDWKSISSTQSVKWPANDTRYTNLLLTLYF